MLDYIFPLLFPKDSESLKILDIRLREVGAKRPLNGTSKVDRQTNRQTDGQTHRRTFRLIESIGPEGRCFENKGKTKHKVKQHCAENEFLWLWETLNWPRMSRLGIWCLFFVSSDKTNDWGALSLSKAELWPVDQKMIRSHSLGGRRKIISVLILSHPPTQATLYGQVTNAIIMKLYRVALSMKNIENLRFVLRFGVNFSTPWSLKKP